MPANEPKVSHTHWHGDGCRLWCPTCSYRKNGSQAAVNAAAVKHVKATGHRVQCYRRQWKAVSPF